MLKPRNEFGMFPSSAFGASPGGQNIPHPAAQRITKGAEARRRWECGRLCVRNMDLVLFFWISPTLGDPHQTCSKGRIGQSTDASTLTVGYSRGFTW